MRLCILVVLVVLRTESSSFSVTWKWRSGKRSHELPRYGPKGIFNDSLTPGSMSFSAFAWNDSLLYRFGSVNQLWVLNLTSHVWAWISGSQTPKIPGLIGNGTQPSYPGARIGTTINIIQRDLWLYGGSGYGVSDIKLGVLGDLWRFDTDHNTWEFVAGSIKIDSTPVYTGTVLHPGGRKQHCSAVSDDELFVFSGDDPHRIYRQFYSDLWSFNTTSRRWSFLKGFQALNEKEVYPNLGQETSTAQPEARVHASMVAYKRFLYLFGGESNRELRLSALWRYNIRTNMWAWISGSSLAEQTNSWGDRGKASPGAAPLARERHTMIATPDYFFLFGGKGKFLNGRLGHFSDLWTYSVSQNMWAWLWGSPGEEVAGIYTNYSTAKPGSRFNVGLGFLNEILVLYGGNAYFSQSAEGPVSNSWDLHGLCSLGHAFNTSSCENCTPGTLRNGLFCTYCPAGTFSKLPGEKSCDVCIGTRMGYGSQKGATVCAICGLGMFGTANQQCLQCSPGQFGNSTGMTTCHRCPPGKTSVLGDSSCHFCLPGRYSGTGLSCLPCSRDNYTDKDGSTLCSSCIKGKKAGIGFSYCVQCTPGKYLTSSYTCKNCSTGEFLPVQNIESKCQKCPRGTAGIFQGASHCVKCSPGRYTKYTGLPQCQECSQQKISTLLMQSYCTQCTIGRFSEQKGGSMCDMCGGLIQGQQEGYLPRDPKKRSDCFCAEGFYGKPYSYSPGENLCRKCNGGTQCPLNSSIPLVQSGWKRSPGDVSVAFKCNPSYSCVTDPFGIVTKCAEGYTGNLCGECIPGSHYRNGVDCIECDRFSILGFPLFFILVLSGIFISLKNSTPEEQKTAAITIVVFWLQLVNVVSSVVPSWSPIVKWIFTLSSLLNLNLDLLAPDCSFTVSYWTRWHIKMISPLVLGSLQLIFFVVQEANIHKRFYLFDVTLWKVVKLLWKKFLITTANIGHICEETEKEQADHDVPAESLKAAVVSLSYLPEIDLQESRDKDDLELLYPYRFSRYVYSFLSIFISLYVLIGLTSFEMLQCARQPNGEYLMAANTNQVCFDAFWFQVLVANVIFSVYALILFPLYIMSLFKSRDEYEEYGFSNYFGTISLPYKEKVYWWPLVEIGFRFNIVVTIKLVAFLQPNLGLILALCEIIVFDALMVHYRPYKTRLNTRVSLLYVVSSLCII